MDNPLQLQLVNFKKDAYIIVEGKSNADYFYILRSGKVRISKEVQVVAEDDQAALQPGDFFGVVSTMSSHSHIETTQALTDVSLIQVHRDQYGVLIERNAPVAMKIIQGFSKKVRYLDEALTKLTFKNSSEGDASHLFSVAEYYAKQSKYNQAFFAYYQYIKANPQGEQTATAKDRMGKIKPYAKVAFLEPPEDVFTRSYPKDTMIFAEGQNGQEMYIIQKGQVKISKIVGDKEVLLAILKAGDIFGEMSLIENKARSASADAYEDAVLLAVNRANFQRMVTTQPQIITRLTTLLAERIWSLYRQLYNATLENPVGRLFDALQLQMEKARVVLKPGVSYTFAFGPKDLLNMVGFSSAEGNIFIKEMMTSQGFKLVDNKIYVQDMTEVERQAKYFRKMDRLNKNRAEAKSQR
ncbi:MAG: cyclic nucleotide-binding domain-containing protein [Spirochaetales bacterium]